MVKKTQSVAPTEAQADFIKTSQARLELPAADMERVRQTARSIGLSLSAFIRLAVLEKAVDIKKRME